MLGGIQNFEILYILSSTYKCDSLSLDNNRVSNFFNKKKSEHIFFS